MIHWTESRTGANQVIGNAVPVRLPEAVGHHIMKAETEC